jgi:hypothetical protein
MKRSYFDRIRLKHMSIFLVLWGLLVLLPAEPILAEDENTYAVSRWTVTGGSSTCRGSSYTLSSTTGQPDAGVLNGGNYVLVGGVWGGIAPTGDGHTIYLPVILR